MRDALKNGELKVLGRLVDASNASLLCDVEDTDGSTTRVIYKPIAGERPLWDFPEGNLAGREVATYLLSELLGLGVVPETILRDGPYGMGAVQRWIEVDESIDTTQYADSLKPAIRKIAFLDAIVNNTDRKFGHLLPKNDYEIYGCDHGLTFHQVEKLRTVLWQFAGEAFNFEEVEGLKSLMRLMPLGVLKDHISAPEMTALEKRVQKLLKAGEFPQPSEEWPSVPWPPF